MKQTRPIPGSFFVPKAGLVGIEEIDADHDEIVQALEALRLHLDDDGFPAVAKIHDVVAHLTGHFEREEYLMRQTAYPNADDHARHHHRALTEIWRVVAQVDANGAVGLAELRDLFRVLMDDIFPADLHFHDYLVSTNRLR